MNTHMHPIKHPSLAVLDELVDDDSELWTVERIRHLTHLRNFCTVKDMLLMTRSYTLGISLASSLFLGSIKYSEELKATDEFDRIQEISAMFLLELLDKADKWETYLLWFKFLRENANSYVSYERHILSHEGNDIDEFIVGHSDGDSLVHNLYFYRRRRDIIERKLERWRSGKSYKNDLHHNKDELSDMDIKSRIMRCAQFYEKQREAEEFWKSFWKK